MNIVIAHFNSNWVDMYGGVEKVTCQWANAMQARGHQVTILYRDNREGDPFFALDQEVPTHNILFQNGKEIISPFLPTRWRIARELVRVFSQKKAQAINAQYKGRQYAQSIEKWLSYLQPDIILSTSIQSTAYTIEAIQKEIPIITMIHADPGLQFSLLSEKEREAVSMGAAIQILLPSGEEAVHAYFPNTPVYIIGNPIEPYSCTRGGIVKIMS